MKRIRIVGCGACDRGDDEAGLLAAEALRQLVPPKIEVIKNTAGGALLLDWCQEVDILVLIDAALATAQFPVGASLRIVFPDERHLLATIRIPGTHAFSLADALRLAETLGQLPGEVIMFLLAGDQFQPGTTLSGALRQPLVGLVEQVRRELTP